MTPLAMAEVAPRIRTRLGFLELATSRDPLPEGRIECRVDVAREVLPQRVEGLELPGGHTRVFCGVYAAAVLLRDAGEAVEQIEADFGADGEIECESNAGCGEGKHAG